MTTLITEKILRLRKLLKFVTFPLDFGEVLTRRKPDTATLRAAGDQATLTQLWSTLIFIH